jgi:anthranilate phosphoribosyltransferase
MIKNYFIEPKSFRMNRYAKEEILGGTVNENVKITNDILKGWGSGAKRDIVLLNTAAALVVGQVAGDINDGIAMAKEAIAGGAAFKKLEELIKFTNS